MTPEMNSFGQRIGPVVSHWKEPDWPLQDPMHGNDCVLEAIHPVRHADDLFASNRLDAQGTNWTYLPYGPFDSLNEFRDWIDQNCLSRDPLFFAIVDSRTNDAVGVASYLDIKPANGSIEIGHLNFSPKLQRTRAATEAMFLMMSRAFDSGYRRLQWKCNALNTSSRSSAQRLGLSYEGTFRQATVSKGRNRDTAWYAAIDSEWPSLKLAFQTWLNPTNFDETGQQRVSLSELTAPVLKQRG